jgi:hypothetical protein
VLVLGYPRSIRAADQSIVIPPFHTGHLGLVPNTPVRVGLVAAPPGAEHCEVVVTPFDQEVRYLALVSVTMRDEPGVVARLVEAVAALGANIEVQESSSINLLDHHFVSLLVDLAESPTLTTGGEFASPTALPTSPTAVQRLYRDYTPLFPVQDYRFVQLFESIIAHCADVIVWKTIAREYFPDVEIRPMPDRPLSKAVAGAVEPGPQAKKLQGRVKVPDEIRRRMRRVLGDQPLEYVLVSDTTTRTLHAFFLQAETSARLFHVGVYHDDVPGALAVILGLMRDAGFNILTSLVRKHALGQGVWEAVVAAPAGSALPRRRAAENLLDEQEAEWIADRLVECCREPVMDLGLRIGRPRYPAPKRKADPPEPVDISRRLPRAPARRANPEPDYKRLLRERHLALAKRSLDPEVARKSEQLLGIIDDRLKEGSGRPSIFLSYPHRARHLAERVSDRLGPRYRIDKYDEADGEQIADEVIRRISDNDYFIGIWHHESAPQAGRRTRGPRTANISPWMLFEYGVARAAEKPAIVALSTQLDQDVVKRINPGVANPQYAERDFELVLEIIEQYCLRHFR